MKRICHFLLMIGVLCSIMSCAAKATTPGAKIYNETGLAKPGIYHLTFLLDGRDMLSEYLLGEIGKNPSLNEFGLAGLMKLFRNAYPHLYLPVQPGVPLCNLDNNFKHCKGIELMVDFQLYGDGTILLHSRAVYHINIRLDGDQPNFFRAAMAQRDRGEFALPRHYYVGSLVDAIQKALPILQEIATDYRKYLKSDDQVIEIELALEESPRRALAQQSDHNMKDAIEVGGSAMLSVLPNISFLTGLTISALRSGGRTFWEVLKEKKEFEIYREKLDIDQVNFSYADSISNNLRYVLKISEELPSDIIIHDIIIRLRQKEKKGLSTQRHPGSP